MAFLSPPPPGSGPFHPPHNPPPPRPNPYLLPARRRRPAAFALPNPTTRPNRVVHIKEIDVLGRKKLPQSVIDKHIAPLEGERVTVKHVFQCVDRVNRWFAENGFVCSRLVVLQLPRWFSHSLVLFSSEPRLVAVRRVAVDKDAKPEEGTQILTREQTICRAVGIRVGDVFEWKPAGFGALMALGLFEYANAEVNVVSNDQVELILHLRERPPGRIEPGAGMSSDGRVYGDISIVDNNFMGRAQRLRIEWQKRLDVARSAGGIVFEDMRVGADIPISFRLRAYRDSNSGRGIPAGRVPRQMGEGRTVEAGVVDTTPLRYEKDRDGVMVDLGYRPKDTNMCFNLTPMFEVVHPQHVDRTGGPPAAQMVLQTSYTHATRLPIDLPRFGHLARIEQFVGSTLANPKEAFHRTVVRLSQYFGVGSVASLAAGTTIGIGSDNLPWHEQKSLGGPSTVRGYEYGELGRYKSFGHGRLELRVPLTPVKKGEGQVPLPEKQQRSNKEPKQVADGGKGEDDAKEENGTVMPVSPFDKLPPLVGVLFGDVAVSDANDRETLGASYGLGLRIGGVIAVHWCRTIDDGQSRLHFGLIDRSL